MSQPKKKVSRGRRDRRRHAANRGVSVVLGSVCPETGELVRSHGLPKNFQDSAYYKSRFETSAKA